MGTSTSQRSPGTGSWSLANAVLGRADVGLARQSQELWRAAVADREGRLADELGNDFIASAAQAVQAAVSPLDAVAAFDNRLASERASGVVLDLAKRALARVAATGGGLPNFAAELFAETSAYYVARDLSSYVGAAGRVKSTSEAVNLKSQFRELTHNTVRSAGPPPSSPDDWSNYVNTVLHRLTGRS